MSRFYSEREIRNEAAWSFETANFFVGFYAEAEDMDPADSFEFDEDIEAVRSGSVEWFAAAVRVYLKDDDDYAWKEVGADHLSGCAYASIREFYTSHRDSADEYRNTLANKEKGIVICHYFPDMVRIAIGEARKTVRRMGAVAATMRETA